MALCVKGFAPGGRWRQQWQASNSAFHGNRRPLLPGPPAHPALPPTWPAAVETYHLLSQRWFTHASPTLFNAGTPRPQLSSCFLVCMKNDSIEGARGAGDGADLATLLLSWQCLC